MWLILGIAWVLFGLIVLWFGAIMDANLVYENKPLRAKAVAYRTDIEMADTWTQDLLK
jgi:hypothetical protein